MSPLSAAGWSGPDLPLPRSKFGCPTVPARAIPRPRLAEILSDDEWRVALVTGGAATGKTVVVAQWFSALDGVAAEWVTLDANDDRPERFWLTFAVALERAVPGGFAGSVNAAADLHRLPARFIDQLLLEWSKITEPLVIVLDDVHHLRDPAIAEDLAVVVEQLPRGSRILLTSRVDPRLPIGRWRSRSWLAELRQRDLALTLPETVQLFTALGELRLDADEIETLWRHTEGWVAGLRLAATALQDRADVAVAVAEFSGRNAMVADLLADEILDRGPAELTEFLLNTCVVEVLDAELCDALAQRSDSGDVLRNMEAELQFVTATSPDRATYRYHPLLAEMLRSELARRRPEDVQSLNRLAAAILENRGDIPGAVPRLLAAGDIDRAFSIVFVAAYRRHDLGDIAGVSAFANLFPLELVTETPSRMLTYALTLGLCGRAAEAVSWLQRAALRIHDDPEPSVTDIATLDALRLLAFTVTGELDDEIEAGCRAVTAIDQGLDLGIVGGRTRMNLVRGYLLVDDPEAAARTLTSGDPGDEIASLLLAPALTARVALRNGHLHDAQRHATTALRAASAFGLDTHFGAIDAHLAATGVLIDRDQLAEASAAIGHLEHLVDGHPEAGPHRVLVQLDKVRIAAGRGDRDDGFRILDDLAKLTGDLPRSAVRRLVDAVAARWHLDAGDTNRAAELIAGLDPDSPAHTLLRARLDLTGGRPDDAAARLSSTDFASMRDRLTAQLLLARAAIDGGTTPDPHIGCAVELAAPEGLIRAIVEEGVAVTRLARAEAESLGTEVGDQFAVGLGLPPTVRGATRHTAVVLSDREISVLRFLPSRLTNAQIGSECLMSVNTVKTHLKSIYAKLGVASRAEAVDRARVLGLL